MIAGSQAEAEPEFSSPPSPAQKKTMPVRSTSIVDSAIRGELRRLNGPTRPGFFGQCRGRPSGLAPKAWPRRLVLPRVLGRQIDRDRPARQEDRQGVLGELPAVLVVVRRRNGRRRPHFAFFFLAAAAAGEAAIAAMTTANTNFFIVQSPCYAPHAGGDTPSTIAWPIKDTNSESGRRACFCLLCVCFDDAASSMPNAADASARGTATRKYSIQPIEPTPDAKHQTPIPSVREHTRKTRARPQRPRRAATS